jgi:hypothetical protein
MLQAKFLNSYRSKASKEIRARYTVTGSPAELDAYKKHQGANLRFSDDGTTPLIFAVCPLDQGRLYNISFVKDIGYFVDFNEITAAAGSIETAEKKGSARLADKVAELQARQLMGSGISSAAASAFDAETPQESAPKAKANLKNPVGS